MAKVYFLQQPNEILRVEEVNVPIESDLMTLRIRDIIQDIALEHAAEDGFEETRFITSKRNLAVFIKFLYV